MESHKHFTKVVDSSRDTKILKSLGIEVRVKILELLQNQELNVSEISRQLRIPQSTATISIIALEEAGLIDTHTANGVKGGQKICTSRYKELLIHFNPLKNQIKDHVVTVDMPIGLFTSHEISAPCGLCSKQNIIGFLDVPETFFSPERIKASLVWFENGYVEYQFPNNALYLKKQDLIRMELSMEMSSEVPGTNPKWPSDISVWINEREIGVWTSPGDFGNRRGKFTPTFWKLEGSQYGYLTTWEITNNGTFIDRRQVSEVTLKDLLLDEHHSIKVRIGITENAKHSGGINIFGKGFGDYDQDIILKLYFNEKLD